jgi:hypothetical protein
LTNCLTKHSQVVIHPGRLKSHHRHCKATGKCGPESSKPDVLEKLWDRAAQALKGTSSGKLVISFGNPEYTDLDGPRCGFI